MATLQRWLSPQERHPPKWSVQANRRKRKLRPAPESLATKLRRLMDDRMREVLIPWELCGPNDYPKDPQ